MAAIPVERVADYEQVALDPHTRRYFAERRDPLFNFHVTARAAASYIGFEPRLPWQSVVTPALVMIGGADGMVTPEYTQRVLAGARPRTRTTPRFRGPDISFFSTTSASRSDR